MRRDNLVILICLLAVIVFLTGYDKRSDPEENSNAALMLDEVNKFRRSGCRCGKEMMPPVGALSWNDTLAEAAKFHARDMHDNKYFEHIGRDGRAPIQRAAMMGYRGTVVGENIGRGTSSVLRVVQGWKSSESHCKNMMDGNFSEMGAAHYQGYWVQELGGNVTFNKEIKPAGLGMINQSMKGGLFFMKKLAIVLIVAMAFVVVHQSSISFANDDVDVKATWSSSAQWASWTNGGYTLYNNIWGSGAGSQSIWANSYSNWGVWANHPNTSGIKSYPNCEKVVNKKISAISTLKSSFNATVPSSGKYNTAYDIWCGSNKYEIMLWMNKKGSVNPIASSYDSSGNPVAAYKSQSIGGHTWNVYKGNNGSNAVYSFVRTSNTSSGTVDIKAILTWIKNKGWFGDVTVGKVQLGWEITSSNGGLNFTMNSYSVTSN